MPEVYESVLEDQSHVSSPEPLPETREELETKVRKILSQYDRFEKNLNQLRRNFPDTYKRMTERNPKFNEHVSDLDGLANEIRRLEESPDDEELNFYIKTYLSIAKPINRMMRFAAINDEELQWRIDRYGQLAGINIPGELEKLGPEAKKEIAKFARQLWEEMFPESYVNKFVRWATGQKKLAGYQKILLAPANGIEAAVGGIISLADPDTYKDLADAVQTMYNMSYEDLCNTLHFMKLMYNELSATDTVSASITLIYGLVFLGGGIGKMKKILTKLKVPPALQHMMATIPGGGKIAKGIKLAPAAVLGNMSLKLI